ncbi:MAG: hypothetical protein AB8H47_12375 [Bacteroidia bacterium]
MKTFIGLSLCLLCLSCAGSKTMALLKQGQTQAEAFYNEIPFQYVNDHIFIKVEIEGRAYNFLFDTGFPISFIDDDLIPLVDYDPVLKTKISGSSFKKHTAEFGSLSKITIDKIDFLDIGVGAEDLKYINDDYICENPVHGVIGANLLRNAKWQIDYQKQLIRFTNDLSKLNIDQEAIVLDMTPRQQGYGYCTLSLNLDGIEKDFVFDTGSAGSFTSGLDFWKEVETLEPDYITSFYGNELAGKTLYPKYSILINEIKIGDLAINNALLSLEKGVSSLIGNNFLKHYLVSIDWDHNQLYLSPISSPQALVLTGFELILQPQYDSNKIIVGAKRSGTDYNEIPLGTQVLSINDEDVSTYSQAQLCQFWRDQWPSITSNDQITIKVAGVDEALKLTKKQLLPK